MGLKYFCKIINIPIMTKSKNSYILPRYKRSALINMLLHVNTVLNFCKSSISWASLDDKNNLWSKQTLYNDMQVKKNSSNLTEPPDYNCQNSFTVSLITHLDNQIFFVKSNINAYFRFC